MAKNPRKPLQTRKHLARVERERRQTRLIVIITIAVILLVAGSIIYGVLNETILKARQPVAIVNGQKISTRDFQARTKYIRQQLIGNAINTYQFMQLFGDSPETQAQFTSQLAQIQAQLEPTFLGQQIIDQMIDDLLIEQEAARRGITVSEEEIDKGMEEAFGYFPEGTPTPVPTLETLPTSTLSPLQLTLVPPTSTPTATPEATAVITPTATPTTTATATLIPTSTPTSGPTQTPTPYTFEAFREQYEQTIQNYEDSINFNEEDLRGILRNQLLRAKVREAVLAELALSPVEEQVWARHILLPDKSVADLVIQRLAEGTPWQELASELSTDESNKDRGGDLGWFGRGQMVAEFEEAVFSLEIGEVSEPVETPFGWHIIQVLGHEMRPLSNAAFQQMQDQKFAEWLQGLRESAEIEIHEYWIERVPEEPEFPPELAAFIQQGQPQNPALPPLPTPEE